MFLGYRSGHCSWNDADTMMPVQFAQYQEMQRMFKLEKAAWQEQHGSGKRAFNPAASFNLGSVVGSVRNALRGAAFQPPQAQDASMDEPSMHEHTAGVIAVPDMDVLYNPPVAPIPVCSAALRERTLVECEDSGMWCMAILVHPWQMHLACFISRAAAPIRQLASLLAGSSNSGRC